MRFVIQRPDGSYFCERAGRGDYDRTPWVRAVEDADVFTLLMTNDREKPFRTEPPLPWGVVGDELSVRPVKVSVSVDPL